MNAKRFRHLSLGIGALVGALFAVLGSTTVSATEIQITMTGTLSSGGASFPWGLASNTVPASTFYSIDGDSYVANVTFNTSVGTIVTSPGPSYDLSGPATIASGDVVVAGHTFAVPSCVDDPCTTTTTALYGRSADSIVVLFYEDASASAGLVLEADAQTPCGEQVLPIRSMTPQLIVRV